MQKLRPLIYLFLIPLFLLTGCALTRDHVSLEYNSLTQPQVVPHAEKVHVKVDVQDHRVEKSKISCKKNGYGMEMASILSKEDIATIINQAISQELTDRGFILEAIENPNVVIDVELVKFYSDFKVGFFSSESVSELIMNVKAGNTLNKNSYRRVISSVGKESPVFIHGGKNAKRSLEDVLRKGVAELMEDREFLETLLNAN